MTTGWNSLDTPPIKEEERNGLFQAKFDVYQDGGSDGTDRFLRAAPCSQTVELSLEIAAFLADPGPGALDEGGLEPGSAFTHAVGPAFPGTLIVPGTKARP